jgi:SAM-dependent methyltransferase
LLASPFPMDGSTDATAVDSAGYWDSAIAPFGDGGSWREHCDVVHRRLLARWLTSERIQRALKTDLFDETVGPGIVTDIARYARSVHAVDVSAIAVASGRRRTPVHASRADVRRLPFRDASFELIVSNSTLDHFPHRDDIAVSLRELHRVTAAGGQLVVTFDNLSNPVVALRSIIPFPVLRALGLVPYFVGATLTRRGLITALEAAGYRVEATTTLLHVPRVVAVWWCRRRDTRVPSRRAALLRRLDGWERLGHWPTARWTGHYIAALAVRE